MLYLPYTYRTLYMGGGMSMTKPPIIRLWKDKNNHLTYTGKKALVSMRDHERRAVKDICNTLDISTKTYYTWWNRYAQFGIRGLKGPHVQRVKPSKSEISSEKKRYIVNQRKKDRSYNDIAKELCIAKSTVCLWWKRYKDEGWEILNEKSRRPNTIEATHPAVVEEVVKNRKKNGWNQHKISADLEIWKKILISHGTIYHILCAHGLIKPTKRRGVQKSYIRWQRDHPDSLWQIDLHVIKTGIYKGKILISALDDCTRKIIVAHIQDGYSIEPFLEILKSIFAHRKPRQILTDNGSQFVAVLNMKEDGRTKFQKLLIENGIQHIRARIKHPQTLGKIERFHRSFDNEYPRHCGLDEYIYFYNYLRPHHSLDLRTPASAYEFDYIAEALVLEKAEV